MQTSEYWRPFPRVIRIEPAAACNLSCSHCPTGTVAMPRGVMASPTFSIVLDHVKRHIDFVKVVVLYHGGEPLLNKNFTNMVRSIKDLGVPFVKTVTNGMLLPDSLVSGIMESGLDAIEFSFDGESPEENDFIRRDCDYGTVVANIKRLFDAKRSKQLDRPFVIVSTAQFVKHESNLKDKKPQVPKFLLSEFSGEYQGAISEYKCTYAMKWPHMEVDGNIYELYRDPLDEDTRSYCDNVENTLTVRWNGDVVACCFDLTSQYVLGNIHQLDLATIWNSERYLNLRRSIRRREFINMCNNCNVVRPGIYLALKSERGCTKKS